MQVLLVHAGVCDSRQWARQIELLAAYDVIAPDLPGYGNAAPPEGEFSIVDALVPLLDGPAAVVGNSFGGRIALQLALERPDLVDRLMLVAPGLPGWDWSPEFHAYNAAEEAALERGDVDALVEVNMEFWVQPHVRDVVRPMQRRAVEVDLAAPEASPRPGPPIDPGAVACPTTIAIGGQDIPDMRAIAAKLAGEIPGARLETIPEAGHLPNLETPEEFDRLLLEFLED